MGVCVCVRERERERNSQFVDVFLSFFCLSHSHFPLLFLVAVTHFLFPPKASRRVTTH